MAIQTIISGSSFSANKVAIHEMLIELAEDGLDITSAGYRDHNAQAIMDQLTSVLTTLVRTDEIIQLPTGTSFRANRKFIRTMFASCYRV